VRCLCGVRCAVGMRDSDGLEGGKGGKRLQHCMYRHPTILSILYCVRGTLPGSVSPVHTQQYGTWMQLCPEGPSCLPSIASFLLTRSSRSKRTHRQGSMKKGINDLRQCVPTRAQGKTSLPGPLQCQPNNNQRSVGVGRRAKEDSSDKSRLLICT